MPRTGRRKAVLELIDPEREQLVGWERRRKFSQVLVLRSWIVLRCAAGLSSMEVAAVVGVTVSRVGKWRSRFCELWLEGLVDDLRPGRPARITTGQVGELLVATLESTPPRRDALDARVDGQAPTYSSQINQVERSFAYLTDDLLRRSDHRSDHRSVQALEKTHPLVGSGVKSEPQAVHLDQIRRGVLAKLARLLQRINGAGH